MQLVAAHTLLSLHLYMGGNNAAWSKAEASHLTSVPGRVRTSKHVRSMILLPLQPSAAPATTWLLGCCLAARAWLGAAASPAQHLCTRSAVS